jgi:hypothetical protein
MSGSSRVKRTPAELRDALTDQVAMLQLSVANFDGGAVVAGKQLATVLRTLLYAPTVTRKGNRTSPLLHQLGLVSHRFLDTACSIDPSQLAVLQGPGPRSSHVPYCGLVEVEVTDKGAAYFAPLDDREPGQWPSNPFPTWWTKAILRDMDGGTASRLDLVSHVASTDGGAHVDADLDRHYARWRAGVSLGWAIQRGGGPVEPLREIELHCMRQIAHEVLRTLRGAAAWAFARPYEYPHRPAREHQRAVFRQGMALTGGAQFKFEGTDMVLTTAA